MTARKNNKILIKKEKKSSYEWSTVGMGGGERANPEWHNRALNMRRLTPVDTIVLFFKNRLLFHKLIIFNTKKGAWQVGAIAADGHEGRFMTDLIPFLPTKTHTAWSSSVPLSNQLQNLPDGDGLTWYINTKN